MTPPIAFNNSYVKLPERFYRRLDPSVVQAPALVRVNGPLAEYLGIDPAWLQGDQGARLVAGNLVPQGAEPIATAYAGHQFGQFNPQLGDGRAILLGEVIARDGVRHDLQLKGSGPTPYSRGGDGRSPLGPVLREYVVSEAMAAMGVPTTRSLAAATTGQPVFRESSLPGGVLLRVARSHIRFGTFEFFAERRDLDGLQRLLDHVIMRHDPDSARAAVPALALLEAVVERLAHLVARWQSLGFIHGVMNTDNMLICGDTIDYGPCAFLDEYNPKKVFSSIDRMGRYAYDNQGPIAQWNLAVLAQALVPLFGDDEASLRTGLEQAQALVDGFPERYGQIRQRYLRAKLGLSTEEAEDTGLIEALLKEMHEGAADFTLAFRHLYDLCARECLADGSANDPDAAVAPLLEGWLPSQGWMSRWRARLPRDPRSGQARAAAMRSVNPALIPRNHLIEAAIADAQERDDLGAFHALVDALQDPQGYDPSLAHFASPPRPQERVARTFCGT